MIVEKHIRPIAEPQNQGSPVDKKVTTLEEAYKTNALVEAYHAIREILSEIKVDPNDENSQPLFRTIKLDTGQLSRLKNNKHNQEYLFACPAVLIHYVNLYYNVGTSRIAEGKGVMRIHYILNTLNNEDDKVEERGFEVYNQIVTAIEANKNKFPALVSKFQLAYWDMPETFNDGLQPFWIDYTIWFSEYSSYKYKDYVDRYLVVPPFTNHSDQLSEHNEDSHENHRTPTYEEVSTIVNADEMQ